MRRMIVHYLMVCFHCHPARHSDYGDPAPFGFSGADTVVNTSCLGVNFDPCPGSLGEYPSQAAVACPGRKVFSMQADGAAMYTLQALWTQAREQLDVTTVLFSNRAYNILHSELKRITPGRPGPRATEVLDLDNPSLDWVQLAQGMGVSGTKATTADDFNRQLESAIAAPGPHLIEVLV